MSGPGRLDGFVILAGMRTGSNFLQANLNALPGVRCHGEVFNPHFVDRQGGTALFGIDMAARDADPLALLAALRQPGVLPGFRFFHDHDPRVLARVMPDPRWAKVVLTRSPAETYVSWKIAQATDQWRLGDAAALRQARIRFDEPEFRHHLAETQAFHRVLRRALQSTGQAAFAIDYDDLRDLDVLNGLAAFLGVEGRLAALDAGLKKQNPAPLADKVSNPEGMAAALAGVDWAGADRIPALEPRRPAMVPEHVAATGAGLLFMPIPGGPGPAVADWLSRLGSGGTRSGLDQKGLRQWARGAGVHRSFTAVRHPLARAHRAFRATLLSAGALPEARRALVRLTGIDPAAAATAEAHRAAFLGFLRLARLNLGGQTGFRTPPDWASQLATIQGFAQVRPPDAILREDRLAEGLAFLAAEVGATAPAPASEPDDGPWPLAAIADADCEAAARAAYARDYATFGFADWRP